MFFVLFLFLSFFSNARCFHRQNTSGERTASQAVSYSCAAVIISLHFLPSPLGLFLGREGHQLSNVFGSTCIAVSFPEAELTFRKKGSQVLRTPSHSGALYSVLSHWIFRKTLPAMCLVLRASTVLPSVSPHATWGLHTFSYPEGMGA